MTNVIINAQMAPCGSLHLIHWYYGPFKFTSKGFFRAIYRPIQKIITQRR